ncbi:Chaperone protein DnaJ [Candidatus Gugararchaeum adminiculabundum]|nr:Chaperone protein DnaJ [Candidatus Gugararchaeum adminiculabundum]
MRSFCKKIWGSWSISNQRPQLEKKIVDAFVDAFTAIPSTGSSRGYSGYNSLKELLDFFMKYSKGDDMISYFKQKDVAPKISRKVIELAVETMSRACASHQFDMERLMLLNSLIDAQDSPLLRVMGVDLEEKFWEVLKKAIQRDMPQMTQFTTATYMKQQIDLYKFYMKLVDNFAPDHSTDATRMFGNYTGSGAGSTGGGRSYDRPGAMSATEALKILGLSPGATLPQIKKAHRRLARELHPDLNPNIDQAGKEKFYRVTDAYKSLTATK